MAAKIDVNNEEMLCRVCEILNIDQDLARFYLDKTRWSVETAIDEYYADTAKQTQLAAPIKSPSDDMQTQESFGLPPASDGINKDHLKLLSWNLDGLDVKNIEERTEAVVLTILTKKPDVVILQEVVPYSLKMFKQSCHEYMVLVGEYSVPYFNAILLRRDTIQTNETKLQFIPFPTSKMGRHYLIQPIKFADAKVIVMTSHLESMSSHSAERKKQFKEVLDYMRRQMDGFNVIFGGDTNVRDKEVTAVGGIPEDIQDTWVQRGSPSGEEMTWDSTENDNIETRSYEEKPRLRFDRIFLRPAKNGKRLNVKLFKLTGKQRLRCGRFASDHWAVWLEFAVKK